VNEAALTQASDIPVEAILRDELAHGDIVLGTVGPILGHLLANHDHSLFSDEIVTRLRGMVSDLARQLLAAQAAAAGEENPRGFAAEKVPALTEALLTDTALLAHCHSLALEWQLACRLEARNAIDPVLSPLLQALIASDEATVASTAMAALAAQARFMQSQRRMELALDELPGDLFHRTLVAWRETPDTGDGAAGDQAEARLRGGYDESQSRLGLISRLVTGMGQGAMAALSVSHAGVAIFLSALATASHQDRDLAVLATNDRQLARLALSLRAGGLKPKEIEEQFLHIHPEISLPPGFEALTADRAAEILAASGRWPVG
jgi:hypothetical protein